MASGGFKIADAYVEIEARNGVPDVVGDVVKRLESIDDKIVQIKGQDDVTPVIGKVDGEKLDDKIVELKADDKATDDVAKVDGEKLDDKTVELKADDKASAAIDKAAAKKPGDVIVPVTADDKTEGVLASINGKMKSWASGLSLGVGGLLGAGLIAGIGQANIVGGLQNQMGATPAVAQHYGQVAGQVFAQGFTTNKEAISAAIDSLSSDMQDFGNVSQAEQVKISGKLVKLGENFGDLNTIMQAASNMVSNGLAPNFDTAFDLITVGMQNVGSRGDDLLETLREYSGYFAQLGFDGSEAISLVTQMMKAGAQDTDKAADAVKEFGIRAVEAGGTATGAFQTLGFNVQDIQARIAGGGATAKQAFIEVVQALQGVADPAQRAQLSVQLFGTQSEDTLVRILPKLDLTKLGLENVSGAGDRLTSTLTPMEKITNSFGEAMANLAPIIVPVIKIVSEIAGVLSRVAKGLDDILGIAPKSTKATVTQGQAFNDIKGILNSSADAYPQIIGYVRKTIESMGDGAKTAQKYGISIEDMIGAVAGNDDALVKWSRALQAAQAAGGEDKTQMEGLNSALGELQRGWDQASTETTTNSHATDQNTGSTAGNTAAKKDSASATAAQTDALHALEDAVLGAINKDIAYRQSVKATKDAQAEYTDALKHHKAGSQEVADASIALESAQVRQAQSARDLAEANSKAADANGRNADGTRAYSAEVIKMAEASDGRATPALARMMLNLSDTELKSNGVTVGVNKAGQAVYNLPNGKTIVMSADDQATRRAKEISDYIQSLPPFKTIKLTIDEVIRGGFGTAGTLPGSNPMGQGRLAAGGPVIGPGTDTSDDVPIMASNGEFVIQARASRKYRSLIEAINADRFPSFASGGVVGGGPGVEPMSGTVINNHWQLPPDIDVDLLAAKVSRRMELSRKGRR